MASRLSLLWWWFKSTKRDSIVENSLSIMAGKSDPPPKYDTFVSTPTESDDENTTFSERKNPFQNPEVAEHWRLTYEKSQYECRHVFDPSLTWSEEEEKRLIRKLDWRICLWAVRISLIVSFEKSWLIRGSASCSSAYRLIGITSPKRFLVHSSRIWD